MASDLEIAEGVRLRPIREVAEELDIPEEALQPYGREVAKVDFGFIQGLAERPRGRLVLVTAITPTPAGEGKTTTTIGLGDGLRRLGKRTAICLREPSLGPCFGMKGGATGGGRAQVAPMDRINLHFTGDFHAVAAAHNLLAALIDNHLYWGNALAIDARRVVWRRTLDMNDRALRRIAVGLGGPANGFPREDGFEITSASEIMAVLCLARDRADLERRLGQMVVAFTRDQKPITAAELGAVGAMSALLRDALMPNLVQTLEHTPAFIHGGPFGNIAHGCNSVIATETALRLADFVVTEAGFGADLGAEKFFNIVCRKAGFEPACAVLVATVRALKMHGGVPLKDLAQENLPALEKGLANLARHVLNVRKFGVPAVVAVNRFTGDSEAELACVVRYCTEELGIGAHVCEHWAEGSAGIEELARAVVELAERPKVLDGRGFRLLYPDDLPLWAKMRTIATEIYGAADIIADKRVRDRFRALDAQGYGRLPVCVAKTQYSFSTDPDLKGAPSGHVVPIREVRLAGGAEFVVVICGDIMTMPGLSRRPAALDFEVDAEGRIRGLG